jgi:hypothetical protein
MCSQTQLPGIFGMSVGGSPELGSCRKTRWLEQSSPLFDSGGQNTQRTQGNSPAFSASTPCPDSGQGRSTKNCTVRRSFTRAASRRPRTPLKFADSSIANSAYALKTPSALTNSPIEIDLVIVPHRKILQLLLVLIGS